MSLNGTNVIPDDLGTQNKDELLNLEVNPEGPICLKKLTKQATRELEQKVILKVLQAHRWNRKRSARALGISYRALLYKIQDAGYAATATRALESHAVGRSCQPEDVDQRGTVVSAGIKNATSAETPVGLASAQYLTSGFRLYEDCQEVLASSRESK